MKNRIHLSLIWWLVSITMLFGQIPETISYQGVLQDATGTNVPDGSYMMTFTIYDKSTGGTSLWAESQTVETVKGVFSVILGSVNPLSLSFDKPYWLGMSVDGDDEMNPRIEFTSSPYSLNAKRFVLPFADTINYDSAAFSITNTGTGECIEVTSYGPLALKAQAPGAGVAVLGIGTVIGSTGASVSEIAGVKGEATNPDGLTYGVHGISNSSTTDASGVFGEAVNTAGMIYGVSGLTLSGTDGASGVKGEAFSSISSTNGVWGISRSQTGIGVLGEANPDNPSGGVAIGVEGITASTTDASSGVRGITIGGAGKVYGVSGLTNSTATDAAGVIGEGHSSGVTYGVLGLSDSQTDNAAAVKGYSSAPMGQVYGVHGIIETGSPNSAAVLGQANAATGSAAGVEGTTNSSSDGTVGMRGIALRDMGVSDGVHGGTFSKTNEAKGVHGVAEGETGRTYGVFGETNSNSNDAAGVKGIAQRDAGIIWGVDGESKSVTPGTAGVRGMVGAVDPVPGRATMGVFGITRAAIRTVGVQGEAYFLGTPPNALEARIGVRGFAGPYATENTIRIGVEGDAGDMVPNPFVSSGVRGFIRGSVSSVGYSGILGQAHSTMGSGPEPEIPVGHFGVWGISQSSNMNSAGVLGDATVSGSTNYGVWGRSKSNNSSGSGVRAEGNGVNSPGNPRAAGLDINNGSLRVSGAVKPAGKVDFGPPWATTTTCVNPPSDPESHIHPFAFTQMVTISNPLINSDSYILLTPRFNDAIRGGSVVLTSQMNGSATAWVTFYDCAPPDPMDTGTLYYLIINHD